MTRELLVRRRPVSPITMQVSRQVNASGAAPGPAPPFDFGSIPVFPAGQGATCKPRTGFSEYGCYCGKGKSCPTLDCPGIDDLDECCRQHDIEYGDCDYENRSDPGSACCLITAHADRKFCKCLQQVIAHSSGRKGLYARSAAVLFCDHPRCVVPDEAPPSPKRGGSPLLEPERSFA